jgi:hypothetical protein
VISRKDRLNPSAIDIFWARRGASRSDLSAFRPGEGPDPQKPLWQLSRAQIVRVDWFQRIIRTARRTRGKRVRRSGVMEWRWGRKVQKTSAYRLSYKGVSLGMVGTKGRCWGCRTETESLWHVPCVTVFDAGEGWK